MKPKVIILGHGFTSRLGVARSLGAAGYPVAIVAIDPKYKEVTTRGTKPVDFYSRYVNEFYFCPVDQEQLVFFLLQEFSNTNQKPILFPTSDFTAAAIDANINRLQDFFVFPNICMQSGEIIHWMDKEKQKKRAVECGLNVAHGEIIKVKDGSFFIPQTIKYPCFCKPLCTLSGAKHGLKKCNNSNELYENLKFLSHKRQEIDVMVEEFLTIDKEFALVGFSDGETVTIPGILHILEMAEGGHFGVARKGEVLPITQFAEVVEKFKTFVRSLHFVGLFDIDFLLCKGNIYFDEMNMRIGGSGYAITKCGVNLPRMMADFLSSGAYSNTGAQVQTLATYVNDRMCIDDWLHDYITTEHMRNLFKEADISFIEDCEDSSPYRHFKNDFKRIAFQRIVRKLRKFLKRCLLNR